MTDVVSVDLGSGDSRTALERLWQLYVHDLSEFRGTLPDDEGSYPTERLETFLDDPDGACYLISHDSALVGFALIRGVVTEPKVLGEFLIVRAARRRHVGHQAAIELLRAHPGGWEIAFQEENTAAARFWRRVAADTVGSECTEERRPVPGKPHLPPDNWLTFTLPDPPSHR